MSKREIIQQRNRLTMKSLTVKNPILIFLPVLLYSFVLPAKALATVNLAEPPSIAQINGPVCAGASDVPVYVFRLQITGGTTTLTGINFNTAGSYTTSDIASFRLHYAPGSASTFTSSTEITAAMIIAATAGPQVMTFSQNLPNGIYNFWITCDVNPGATNDDIQVTTIANTAPAPTTNTTAAGNDILLIPYPAAISGNNTICYGAGTATTTLSDASNGGSWSSYTTSVATVDAVTGVVTSAAGGVATVVYDNGCGSPAAYAVYVHSVPDAITGSPNVCPAVHITLSDGAYGGTWSSSTTSIATIDAITGILTGDNPGTTNVTFSTGCGSDATTVITVDPNPATPGLISGTTNICISTSAALTDFTPGGAWSSNNTAVATIDASGNITSISAGTTNISYTITNSCGSRMTSTPVNIYTPVSAPAVITGMSFVCQSASLSLSDTTSGGVWTSTNTAVAVVSPWGDVSGISPGLTTISYTVGNVCGSLASSLTFVVNPLPVVTPITGSSAPFCAGTTISLSDATGGGAWSSDLTSIATVNSSGVVTGVSGDLAGASSTIIYSITNSCGTASATFIITVEPLPVISAINGPSSLCIGSFIVLADTTAGGVWSSSNAGVAGVSSGGLVTGISGGTATISYSKANICGTASQTKVITVNTLPDPGIITGADSVCQNFMITLSDNMAGGVWSCDVLSTAIVNTTGSVIGLAPGVDTIRYTITNSCGAESAGKTIWVRSSEDCNPTAVSAVPRVVPELNVFPNPNNGTFALTLSSLASEPVLVTVTNLVGEKVKEFTTMTNQKSSVELTTPGIYFIAATTATDRYSTRVVVSGQ